MIIRNIINLGIKKLHKTSPSAVIDTEVLLSFVLGKSREYVMINPKKEIKPKDEKDFLKLIDRRAAGWPVAYLTESKEFYGQKFFVNKNVLIPRPETEGLVDLVLDHAKNKKSLSIVDIGTGSGNIIITLAKKLGDKNKYFASDISTSALSVAKKNSKQLKTRIKFAQGNLLKPWGKQRFDIIVANLPYLAKETDRSTKFEPKGALVATKKGLKLYEELFKQLYLLHSTSYILLEIGHDQGPAIKKLARKFWPVSKINIYKDLFGRTRFAVIQL